MEQIEKQNDKFPDIAWIQSHKLRVPVANILGLTALARSKCSARDELIPMFSQEAGRLNALICEITELTQDLDEPV